MDDEKKNVNEEGGGRGLVGYSLYESTRRHSISDIT